MVQQNKKKYDLNEMKSLSNYATYYYLSDQEFQALVPAEQRKESIEEMRAMADTNEIKIDAEELKNFLRQKEDIMKLPNCETELQKILDGIEQK